MQELGLTIKKIMSTSGHKEGEDGQRETAERATDLQCPQKTVNRVSNNENEEKKMYWSWEIDPL